jgi:1,4-alpha-glucan branching enzyme
MIFRLPFELWFITSFFFSGVEIPGGYKVILTTDDEVFGGMKRLDKKVVHFTDPLGFAGRRNFIQVYIPSRTAIVLAKTE